MAATEAAPEAVAEGTTMAEAASCAGGASELENYETVFTNAKAGMEAVDKDAVKKVVYEMSQGSRFFANEQRKDAAVAAKVEALRAARETITPQQLQHLERASAKRVAELDQSRNLSRTWLHVDMDAFYAAVEALECPELATKPMAVGGLSMICTANYEARKFGVRAAMPGFIAVKLCPALVFVRPNFQKYQRYSDMSRNVFRDYDPQFVARSMDEAYLDITEACLARGLTGAQIAEELRGRVREATGGLTCSAGVGANRLLAKVCSDLNKPNGQYVLPNDRTVILDFMATLPIRKVCGIGRVTERLLREVAGITVCGQLISEAALLFALFSPISAEFFLEVGLGVGGEEPVEEEARKSVSCERTFAPLTKLPAILDKLEEIAASLEKDVLGLQLKGRTLTVKLKATDFRTITRAVSVEEPISKKEELLPLAVRLVRAEMPLSLRLIGLRLSGLVSEGDQSLKAHGTQTKLDRFLKGPPARAAEAGKEGERRGAGSAGKASGEGVRVGGDWVRAEARQGGMGGGGQGREEEEQLNSAGPDWGRGAGGASGECGGSEATAKGRRGDPDGLQQLDLRFDPLYDSRNENGGTRGTPTGDARQAEHAERLAAGSAAELGQTGTHGARDVLGGNGARRGPGQAGESSEGTRDGGCDRLQATRYRPEAEREGMPSASERVEGAQAAGAMREQHKKKKGGQTTLETMLEGRERRRERGDHPGRGTSLGVEWQGDEPQDGDANNASAGGTELVWLEGKGPGTVVCSRCREEFPEEQRGEHEDYHFAVDLSSSEGRPALLFPTFRERPVPHKSHVMKSRKVNNTRTKKRPHSHNKPAPGQKVLRPTM